MATAGRPSNLPHAPLEASSREGRARKACPEGIGGLERVMTTTRKVIIAFWIFIVVMLVWNFYSYNRGLTQQAADHPTPDHYFFFHTNAPAVSAGQFHNGADIEQTAFVVQPNTPATGSFTCLVTVKNIGNAKATGIQVCIRPYRGVSTVDIDVGGNRGGTISDDDPIAQISDWLSFPDLAPGESSTQSDVFFARPEIHPGMNPKPKILFETAKPAPAVPVTPVPPRQSSQ